MGLKFDQIGGVCGNVLVTGCALYAIGEKTRYWFFVCEMVSFFLLED